MLRTFHIKTRQIWETKGSECQTINAQIVIHEAKVRGMVTWPMLLRVGHVLSARSVRSGAALQTFVIVLTDINGPAIKIHGQLKTKISYHYTGRKSRLSRIQYLKMAVKIKVAPQIIFIVHITRSKIAECWTAREHRPKFLISPRTALRHQLQFVQKVLCSFSYGVISIPLEAPDKNRA